MKKVAVLTFHYTDNPGSALQAYALKTVIDGFGFECSVLNYQKKGGRMPAYKLYLPYMKKKFKLLGVIAWRLYVLVLKIRQREYRRFQKTSLSMTRKIVRRERLKALDSQFDCFVAGSDQIWNRHNGKVDDTYFLDFVQEKKKKIAYAPSFGVKTLPPAEQAQNIALLQAFGALSVREHEGQEIIRQICGREVPVVLDPTLLLDKSAWGSLSVLPEKRGYILLYLRSLSPSIVRFAENLASATGLELVQIVRLKKHAATGQTISSPGPLQWVGLIENAKYVVTNSFHGIAFSINFNKQFFVEKLSNHQEKTNGRIFNILREFEIEGRFIDGEGDCLKQPDIDYGRINQVLEEKRAFSKAFLQKALENATAQ